MNKISNKSSSYLREKGSKFTGYLFPVETKEAFDDALTGIKNEFPDASHHCYAWRLHPTKLKEFSQDDGEPSGTAGLPILNQLKSFHIVNAGLIVVRYYGGTNLGKSGLIQAYGSAAEQCLQKATLQPIQPIWKVNIVYPYNEQNAIEKLMHQFDLKELASSYTEKVSLVLACPAEHKERLQDELEKLLHRNIKTDFLEESYL